MAAIVLKSCCTSSNLRCNSQQHVGHRQRKNIEHHTNILLINTSNHWVAVIRQTTGEWLLHDDGVISRMSNPSSFLTMLSATSVGSAAYMVGQPRSPTNVIAASTLGDSSAMVMEEDYQSGTQALDTVVRGGAPQLDNCVTNTSPCTTSTLSTSLGHALSMSMAPPPLPPMQFMPTLVSQLLLTQPAMAAALLSQHCPYASLANTIAVLTRNSTPVVASVQIPVESSLQFGCQPHCEYHSRAASGLSTSSTMTCTCHSLHTAFDVPSPTLLSQSPSSLVHLGGHEGLGSAESAVSRAARNARRREQYAAAKGSSEAIARNAARNARRRRLYALERNRALGQNHQHDNNAHRVAEIDDSEQQEHQRLLREAAETMHAALTCSTPDSTDPDVTILCNTPERRSRRRELYSNRTPEQRAHSDLRCRALYANRSPEQVAARSTRRQATYTANAAHR